MSWSSTFLTWALNFFLIFFFSGYLCVYRLLSDLCLWLWPFPWTPTLFTNCLCHSSVWMSNRHIKFIIIINILVIATLLPGFPISVNGIIFQQVVQNNLHLSLFSFPWTPHLIHQWALKRLNLLYLTQIHPILTPSLITSETWNSANTSCLVSLFTCFPSSLFPTTGALVSFTKHKSSCVILLNKHSSNYLSNLQWSPKPLCWFNKI